MLSASYSYLLLLLPAVPLARDDFRTRRVGVVWLAVFGVTALAVGGLCDGWRTMLLHAAVNALLLGLLGVLLAAYLRLCRKRIDRSLGAGDAVFLLVITPLFSPEAYLHFLIAACVLALVWWTFLRPPRRSTIPFVGVAGIALGGWILVKIIRVWLS